MESLPRETVWHVARMCAIWAAISGSYNILHICIPLITRDITEVGAARWLGIFMSTNAICGALFSVLGGFFSDFLGRMSIMRPWAWFFFLTVTATLLAEHFSSLTLLLLAHTSALSIPTTILLAYLSDFLRDAALVESYGYLSGSFGIANFTCTILCGVLNEVFSRDASLWLAVLLSGLALYLVLYSPAPTSVQIAIEERAEETRLRGKKDAVSREEFYRALRLIVADRYLLLICVACSVVRMANMNDHLMLVYFISFRTDAGLSSISYVLGIMAFTMSISQLVFLPFAVRRRWVFHALILGLGVMSICVMSFAFCFSLLQFSFSAIMLGCSLMSPSIFNARISALTSASGISGVTLGVVSTLTNTVEVVMAMIFGNLLEWATHVYSPLAVYSGIPFLVNGATVGLAMLLVLVAEYRYGKKQSPWGAPSKRSSLTVEEFLDSDSLAASDIKLGGGGSGVKEVEEFAGSVPRSSATLMTSTVVTFRPEKLINVENV